jgi:serine/threonine-protein kinase RsbW
MNEPDRNLIDLDLPAVPESAGRARRAVGEALSGIAVDRDGVAAVVSEAVANSAAHAYPEGDGRVRVSADVGADSLEISVSDDGVGMDPGSGSTGLGLGVPLMHDLSDSTEVTSKSGTRLLARFNLFGPAGPHGRQVPRQPGGSWASRRLARLRRRAK